MGGYSSGAVDLSVLATASALASVAANVGATTTEQPAPVSFTSGVAGAYSAWQQIDASSLARTISELFSAASINRTAGEELVAVQFGTGAPGAEVPCAQFEMFNPSSAANGHSAVASSAGLIIPAGTRTVVRSNTNQATGAGILASETLYQQ